MIMGRYIQGEVTPIHSVQYVRDRGSRGQDRFSVPVAVMSDGQRLFGVSVKGQDMIQD